MKIPMTKEAVQAVFNGVLTGEGDIFARMASSHVDANNPFNVYPSKVASMVLILQKTTDLDSPAYGQGEKYAKFFLEDDNNEFLED